MLCGLGGHVVRGGGCRRVVPDFVLRPRLVPQDHMPLRRVLVRAALREAERLRQWLLGLRGVCGPQVVPMRRRSHRSRLLTSNGALPWMAAFVRRLDARHMRRHRRVRLPAGVARHGLRGVDGRDPVQEQLLGAWSVRSSGQRALPMRSRVGGPRVPASARHTLARRHPVAHPHWPRRYERSWDGGGARLVHARARRYAARRLAGPMAHTQGRGLAARRGRGPAAGRTLRALRGMGTHEIWSSRSRGLKSLESHGSMSRLVQFTARSVHYMYCRTGASTRRPDPAPRPPREGDNGCNGRHVDVRAVTDGRVRARALSAGMARAPLVLWGQRSRWQTEPPASSSSVLLRLRRHRGRVAAWSELARCAR